jgi:hypothetical protein
VEHGEQKEVGRLGPGNDELVEVKIESGNIHKPQSQEKELGRLDREGIEHLEPRYLRHTKEVKMEPTAA